MRDFQPSVDALFAALRPSRIILRLERPGAFYPVVAETLADGVRSVASGPEPDFSQAPTFLYVTREQRPLVQDAVEGHPLGLPTALIGHYGVRAQLLVPVVRGDRFVGVVGIHVSDGPRQWTDDELAFADAYARRVAWELELDELRERLGAEATALLDGAGATLAAGAGGPVAALDPDILHRLRDRRTTVVAPEAPAHVLACAAAGDRLRAVVAARFAGPRELAPADVALVEEACARIEPGLAPRAWGGREGSR